MRRVNVVLTDLLSCSALAAQKTPMPNRGTNYTPMGGGHLSMRGSAGTVNGRVFAGGDNVHTLGT